VALIEPEPFRLEKLQELRRLGVDPYGRRFPDATPTAELRDRFAELEGRRVRATGRITNLRGMGKASFLDLRDRTGKVQLYFRKDRLGPELYQVQRLLEPGDIIGVEGELGRTRTGEITVFADSFQVLAKALLSPPEKWHGLKNVEKRCRMRYVDLFSNPEVLERFMKRSRIVAETRAFLSRRGFIEVETPMMQQIPGGAAARPFKTHHNALDLDLYLRIAPELYLKRLLVGGMERVFEINRNFRNEGISTRHNPEFTMLELYQSYADYNELMGLTEELISTLARTACGSLQIPYGQRQMDLTPPWPRRSFWDLLAERAGLSRGDEDGIRARAEALGVDGAHTAHPDWLALQLFDRLVEDGLDGPVFVTDYPRSLCVLAKAKADDPELAERFELYLAGMEVANAYSELNDPLEQERRFLQQVGTEQARERVDRDFVRALAYGMPPAAGLGIGMDRLVMVLTDSPSIREVILFPLLRPEEGTGSAEAAPEQ